MTNTMIVSSCRFAYECVVYGNFGVDVDDGARREGRVRGEDQRHVADKVGAAQILEGELTKSFVRIQSFVLSC